MFDFFTKKFRQNTRFGKLTEVARMLETDPAVAPAVVRVGSSGGPGDQQDGILLRWSENGLFEQILYVVVGCSFDPCSYLEQAWLPGRSFVFVCVVPSREASALYDDVRACCLLLPPPAPNTVRVFCDAHDVGMKGLYNHALTLRGVGRIIAAKVLNCEVHTLGQSVPNVPGPFVPSRTGYSHHL